MATKTFKLVLALLVLLAWIAVIAYCGANFLASGQVTYGFIAGFALVVGLPAAVRFISKNRYALFFFELAD